MSIRPPRLANGPLQSESSKDFPDHLPLPSPAMIYPTALALAVFTTFASSPVAQETRGDPLAAARTAFATGDRAQRLEALEALHHVGCAAALETVMVGLADPDPYVADYAQQLVPRFEMVGALDLLLSQRGIGSKDALIRQRAAESIGRLAGPVNAQALLRRVKKRDPALARTMLWSLERLAERGALSGKKQRTIKSVRMMTGRGDDDTLRAAAIQTLSILDARDGATAMNNLSSGCGIETGCALIEVAVRLKPNDFGCALSQGLLHKEAAVRMRALDLLNRSGIQRNDLDTLVGRFDDEPRAAIRTRVLETLHYFTGHHEGEDIEAWRDFLRTLPQDWTPADVTPSFTKPPNVTGEFDLFEDLDPTSDRIAVLVDISSTYWRASPRGSAIARTVSPALGRLLARVEQTGSFLLVPFAEKPIPFSTRPIAANQANVRRATKYLLEDLPKEPIRDGPSNIAAALDYALSFKELDRIIVISASSEYVGDHADVRLMARLYRERTRFRPAIFDFVLLNGHGVDPPRWFPLANARGGRVYRLRVR